MRSKLSNADWQRLKLLRRIADGSRVSTASYDGALYQLVIDAHVIVDAPLSLSPDYTLLPARLTGQGLAERERLEALVSKAHLSKANPSLSAPLADDVSVDDIPAGIRIRNALKCSGIATVGQAKAIYAEHGAEPFLRIPMFGKAAMRELETILSVPKA